MIRVYPDRIITVWAGFGGALTEASAYNYSLLSSTDKQRFLMAYYGDSGLAYNFGRIAIGSNDFCLAPYEYTAMLNLEDFSIEHERRYLLPMLHDIYKMKRLILVASPWSPPSFMKNNHSLIGGKLKKRYYQRYAEYLRLFLDSFFKEGFKIDYLTMQNEPEAAQRWESCVWSLREQKKFYKYLLPELNGSGAELLMWDHNKEKLFKVVNELYRPEVAGVGFHIYSGVYAEQLRLVREKYPELLMINTESCCAFKGEWKEAAEYYLTDVMMDINCGVNGYIDWNMLLDSEGGPNDANNPVKAPIMLNSERSGFILTPLYEYMKVLAQAFLPGTRTLFVESDDDDLLAVAGLRDKRIIVVLMNKSDKAKKYEINIDGKVVSGMITGHSIIRR